MKTGITQANVTKGTTRITRTRRCELTSCDVHLVRELLVLATQKLGDLRSRSGRKIGQEAIDLQLELSVGEPSDGRINDEVSRAGGLDVDTREKRVSGNLGEVKLDDTAVTLAVGVRNRKLLSPIILAERPRVDARRNSGHRLSDSIDSNNLRVGESQREQLLQGMLTKHRGLVLTREFHSRQQVTLFGQTPVVLRPGQTQRNKDGSLTC